MEIAANREEIERRDLVMREVLAAIREGRVIKLPEFDGTREGSEPRFALSALGSSLGPYSGTLGEFRYQFEGEEDLLHLFVMRLDGQKISVEEAQTVTDFFYGPVPKALIWLKPGEYSQHFYIGHDELLTYLKED